MALRVIVSCEHASPAIPSRYANLFAGKQRLLTSHRSYDAGALQAARYFSKAFKSPLFSGRVSRLLVDLNRAPPHPGLFSHWIRDLSLAAREELLVRYHTPYRKRVQGAIELALRESAVLHLSVHSFAPVLNGRVRPLDLGLLYDPKRGFERELCRDLKATLLEQAPKLRVRLNAPYRGTSEGFTKSLRQMFPDRSYAGIELEFNQRLCRLRRFSQVLESVARSIECVLHG